MEFENIIHIWVRRLSSCSALLLREAGDFCDYLVTCCNRHCWASYRNFQFYSVSIKSFPDYKHLLQENYCAWNTNIFLFPKCNSRSIFLQHISTLQHVLLFLHGERLIDNQFLSTCCLTLGLPLLWRSPTLPVSTNFEYHALILLTSGGGRPYSFLNFRCTVTGDLFRDTTEHIGLSPSLTPFWH